MEKQKVWIPDIRKVLLAKFLDTTMVTDAGTGKYNYVRDFWRTKTYAKDEDKMKAQFDRDFSEPYQYAAHVNDGLWNEYNQPYIVQVGLCNLNCRWCFVPKQLRSGDPETGKYFTAKEVVDSFIDSGLKMLRISGGEPFLAPHFVSDVAWELAKHPNKNPFLWVDTNLLGFGYKEVVDELESAEIPYGICGCFKGFDETDFAWNTTRNDDVTKKTGSLDEQIRIAKITLDAIQNNEHLNERGRHFGKLFFYIPEITREISNSEAEDKIHDFMGKLYFGVNAQAPLRLTVLRIKEYESNKEWKAQNRFPSGKTKEIWKKILSENYFVDQLWLPQYQIEMED